ncbi:hypothetical protein CKA32_000611 [Geitlerinema sp. FC II]|nr:hypothetical protein CKA32_000611 [Geitlerinema sp. FC II]
MSGNMSGKPLEDTPLTVTPERLRLFREYCYLASRPSLSDDQCDRMAELLERAEMDSWLNFWICEADRFFVRFLQLGDRSSLELSEDRLSRLQEYVAVPDDATVGVWSGELKQRVSLSLMEVQETLKQCGFDPGKIDGHGGQKLVEALKHFQRHRHLDPDGIPGKQTQEALGLL